MWWLTPIIPELWETKAGRSGGQEFETSLTNMVKHPHSTKNIRISWVWWHVPVIPATQEAEAGELPEPRRRRLQWRSSHCTPACVTRAKFHLKKNKQTNKQNYKVSLVINAFISLKTKDFPQEPSTYMK